ncbi:MAG: ATPase [Fusobacteriales bacterium]|nr:MAG: ATPase [Fusobacteriales bacterium]
MEDNFLNSEIKLNRESGTYLFYGDDSQRNFSVALDFAKKLFLRDIKDENIRDEISRKIDANIYSDLYIIENLNIEEVRNIIKKTYTSSHEEGIKVFILKNIENIRKESANAMLKVIEEPTQDNFFILLSNKLNILTTIKSRSIIYKVKRQTAEELQVDKYDYDFFMGVSEDIENYKLKKLDLNSEKNFKEIYEAIKNYEEDFSIENKTDIYKCLRNFVQNSEDLKKYEKIKFAEDIFSAISNKKVTILIVDYLLNLVKANKNLKEKLLLKKMLRHPINMKLFFINLILTI